LRELDRWCYDMLDRQSFVFGRFSAIERSLSEITEEMSYISDSRKEEILRKWSGLDEVSYGIGCFFNWRGGAIYGFGRKNAIGWYLPTY